MATPPLATPGSPPPLEVTASREELVMRTLSDLPATKHAVHLTLNKLFYQIHSQIGLRHPSALGDVDAKVIVHICQHICKKLEQPNAFNNWQRLTALAMVARFQSIIQLSWTAEDRTTFDNLIRRQPFDDCMLASRILEDIEGESWHTPIGELFRLEQPEETDPPPTTAFNSLEEVLAWVDSIRPTLNEPDSPNQSAEHDLLLPPPQIHFRADEFSWLDIANPSFHIPLIDTAIGSTSPDRADLLTKATQEVLTIPERQLLLEALSDPRLARSLRSSSIASLVEKNPQIASELLSRYNSSTLESYLEVLLQSPASARCMEVISKLTARLPKMFLQRYICGCIQACEATSDKYMQARLVRLVCVFLQSVVRSVELDPELYTEVSSFCLAYSRIKEAAGLYRQMKLSEGGVE